MPELEWENPSFSSVLPEPSTDKPDIDPADKREIVTGSTLVITEQAIKGGFGWEKQYIDK